MSVAPVLLALDVAASLTASGVDATTRVTPDGGVELLIMLQPWSRTMAVLDVRDLTRVLIDQQDVAVRTVPGPVDQGAQTCDDAACVTEAVWTWVLGWRGTVI